jgi:hypothetical protein
VNLSGPKLVTKSYAAPSKQHVLIKLATVHMWWMYASAVNSAASLVTIGLALTQQLGLEV